MASSDSFVMDEVVRKRLLNDGDGVGDDKRVVQIMRDFYHLINEDSTIETSLLLNRVYAGIAHLKLTAIRDFMAIDHYVGTSKRIFDFRDNLHKSISEAQTEIIASKLRLTEAQKQRKYSVEYDTLARLIEGQPDRVKTEYLLEKLSTETEALAKRKEFLDKGLKTRERCADVLRPIVETIRGFSSEYDLSLAESSQKNGEREKYEDLSESGDDDVSTNYVQNSKN